jgi:hypothetical protein
MALLKDLSPGGIALVVDRRPDMGAVLLVRLPGQHRGACVPRTAVVLRVESEADGYWLAGCRLSLLLSEQALRGLRPRGNGG